MVHRESAPWPSLSAPALTNTSPYSSWSSWRVTRRCTSRAPNSKADFRYVENVQRKRMTVLGFMVFVVQSSTSTYVMQRANSRHLKRNGGRKKNYGSFSAREDQHVTVLAILYGNENRKVVRWFAKGPFARQSHMVFPPFEAHAKNREQKIIISAASSHVLASVGLREASEPNIHPIVAILFPSFLTSERRLEIFCNNSQSIFLSIVRRAKLFPFFAA